MKATLEIAYLEVVLAPEIPTYRGGLGMLAADLEVPLAEAARPSRQQPKQFA